MNFSVFFSTRTRLLIGAQLASLLFSASAFAQYVWLDEKGVKQYSDQAPPASVPKKNILKAPGQRATTPSNNASSDASVAANSAASASSAPAAPRSTQDLNAEFKKRKLELAEKEKKANEEAQVAQNNKRECDRARAYLTRLQDGSRISVTEKNGELGLMDDNRRQTEVREVKEVLAKCN